MAQKQGFLIFRLKLVNDLHTAPFKAIRIGEQHTFGSDAACIGRVVMYAGYSAADALYAWLTYRWDREYQFLPRGMVHPTDAA